jgi:hypothetical protein
MYQISANKMKKFRIKFLQLVYEEYMTHRKPEVITITPCTTCLDCAEYQNNKMKISKLIWNTCTRIDFKLFSLTPVTYTMYSSQHIKNRNCHSELLEHIN